jgi:hypothetical protein
MTPQAALNVLNQAAAKFLGTLEDHNTLQEAAKVLEEALTELEQYKVADKPPVSVPVDVVPGEAAEET